MSGIIAVQPYVRVERTVTAGELKTATHHYSLSLTIRHIAAFERTFPIGDVYDISYRQMGGGAGILYLHTRMGVYPFHIHSNPAAFLEAFKELIR